MPSRRQLFKLPSRRVLLCCAFAAAAPAPPNTTTRVAQRQHEQLVHLHERKREEFLRRHNATAPQRDGAAARAGPRAQHRDDAPAPGENDAHRDDAPPRPHAPPPPRADPPPPRLAPSQQLEWALVSAPKAFVAALGLALTYWVALHLRHGRARGPRRQVRRAEAARDGDVVVRGLESAAARAAAAAAAAAAEAAVADEDRPPRGARRRGGSHVWAGGRLVEGAAGAAAPEAHDERDLPTDSEDSWLAVDPPSEDDARRGGGS
ncbi:hypothetical protein JL722_12656 [Aureococcus anophagefferens]|nr:hypothetical protein JL722_12656 [Aureococcus anophagefferens]